MPAANCVLIALSTAGDGSFPLAPPVITYALIALTSITSVMAFQNRTMMARCLFVPYIIRRNNNEWHRFFSHALIHKDWIHLLFNMYVLYGFGTITEETFYSIFGHGKGMLFYSLLYVGGILLSSFPDFEKHKDNGHYGSLGASGAVSAVVFSFIFIYPVAGMSLLMLPFRMPAFVFGALYLTAESFLEKRGGTGVAHSAHFWGGIFGIVFTLALKFELGYHFVEQVRDYINYYLYGIGEIN